MKVELRNSFTSGLPLFDQHPYRSGAWRPQNREYDAWDLDVMYVVKTFWTVSPSS